MTVTEVRISGKFGQDPQWKVFVWTSWEKAKQFEALVKGQRTKYGRVEQVYTYPVHGAQQPATKAPSGRGVKGADRRAA